MNDRLRQPRDGVALGGFVVDLQLGELLDRAGHRVPLRKQSLAVLLELARHRGAVVSRESLSQSVWQGLYVTDDSLVQCIVEIRRALGRGAVAIKTVPRRGYVLEADDGDALAPSIDAGSTSSAAAEEHSPAATAPAASAKTSAASLVADVALAASTLPAACRAQLPFTGRHTELGFLVDAACARPSLGRLVLISGEPGIGKSRLIEEAALAAAGRGAATLRLECHEIESNVAYGVVSRLVDRLLALLPAAEVLTLDATTRAELALLAPWCSARLQAPAGAAGTEASLRLAHLRAALVGLCVAAARPRPLVLCLDDAHWLDEPSAVAAFALAEAAVAEGWSIWASMRHDEIARNPHAMRLVHALHALPHTHRLELGRLQPHEVAHIVEQVRPRESPPSAAEIDRLVRESAGNPFYLRELLNALGGAADEPAPSGPGHAAARSQAPAVALPPSILESVLQRAAHLRAAARQLLDAAAALEQPTSFEVLAAVAKLERPAALEGLHALLLAGWLAEDREHGRAPRYPFVHDKLREAIYASLSSALARTLHGRAARALVGDVSRRHAEPEHAVVATHALRGGLEALAAEHYALAGDAARRLFELRRAETLYSQALELHEALADRSPLEARLALLEKRGAVRSMLGQAAAAEADLRRAIAWVEPDSPAAATGASQVSSAAMLRLHIELGVMLQRHNRLEGALAALRRALDLAVAANDEGGIAAARCWLGDVEWMREHNREARLHFECLRSAGAHPNPAVAAWTTKALFGLAQCAGMDARPAVADVLLDQALARAHAPAERFFECAWAVLKGWVRIGHHGMGQPEAALEYFERCLRQAAEADLFWYEVPCRIGIGVVHLMQRRLDTAVEHLDAVLSLPANADNGRWQLAAGVWLARCHLDAGDAAAALATARRAERALGEFGPFMFAAQLPALVTIAQARLGRAAQCEDPQALAERARRAELGYVLITALEARAEWLHASGRSPELLGCAEELLREADTRGLPQARSLGVYWRARALGETGHRPNNGGPHVSGAVDTTDEAGIDGIASAPAAPSAQRQRPVPARQRIRRAST